MQRFEDLGDGATTVNIIIYLADDQDHLLEDKDKLLEKFKLTTFLHTNNMHLLDSEGKIKKFDNPKQSKFFAFQSCFEE